MLAEDRVRGKDFGKGLHQLLDRGDFRAIPEVEQAVCYIFTLGFRDVGYDARTQTRCWKSRYSSGRRNRAPRQRGEWSGVQARLVEQEKEA